VKNLARRIRNGCPPIVELLQHRQDYDSGLLVPVVNPPPDLRPPFELDATPSLLNPAKARRSHTGILGVRRPTEIIILDMLGVNNIIAACGRVGASLELGRECQSNLPNGATTNFEDLRDASRIGQSVK
jgi:hypothetical protein